LADSLSANSRAVMSTPEPGPSGTMNLTGRCGQTGACADDGVSADTSAANTKKMNPNTRNSGRRIDVSPSDFVGDKFVNGRRRFVQHGEFRIAAFAWDIAVACINAAVKDISCIRHSVLRAPCCEFATELQLPTIIALQKS